MGALSKLVLSNKPLPNDFHKGKARELDQVHVEVQNRLQGLCDGTLPWPFFLHGRSGVGKSCAALCLVDRVPKSEFWAMPAFVNYVSSIRQGKVEWYKCGRGGTWTEDDYWKKHLANIPLLVLDDVGLREVNTDFHLEMLFLALEARDGKPLICTSNLDVKGIEEAYNVRTRSRICSGTVFELTGSDRRYELSGGEPKPARGEV